MKNKTWFISQFLKVSNILVGVFQGSTFELLLLHIFICGLFLEFENNVFTSYADNTTPYTVGDYTREMITELSNITEKLLT